MKKSKERNIDRLDLFDFHNGRLVERKLLGSKARICAAYSELFSGYDKKAEDVLNETVKVKSYSGIVSMRDIQFYTFCEHHFVPFFGSADVAYQPKGTITGLGKIVRLVRDVHARRLQIQELMTKDIAEDLMQVLDAKGAFVVTRAKHLCICSRGPSDDRAWTEVSYGIGTLKGRSTSEVFAGVPRDAYAHG